MPLVYACVAPHGGEIISELAKDQKSADLFSETRIGMIHLANQLKRARPDTIVIASPHNLRLWKQIGIVFSENSSGYLQSDSKRKGRINLCAKCDPKFARELFSRASSDKLPVVGANYGTFEGPASDLPMDWGTFIPLWFFLNGKRRNGKKINEPKIVIVTPSREIPLQQNIQFGKTIAKLADDLKRQRIAFVASADQAHAHRKDGPYGFHMSAKKYDEIAVEAIKTGKLDPLLKLDPGFVEDAKPDSLWQLAILHGILSELPMSSELFSYQVPTYFGMICAGFSPLK
jgi:aromatic ring-opening dioxygenase LigB subunit